MSSKRLQVPHQAPNLFQIGMILLAVIIVIIAAASGFGDPTPIFPLVVGGVLVGAMIAAAWVRQPVWALYAAIFVILLPEGLISATLQSTLNRALTIAVFLIWLLNALIHRRSVRWTIATWLMICFLAWGMVTLFWAVDLRAGITITQVYLLRILLFLFLIPNLIDTEKKLDGLMKTMALNGWIIALVGLGTILNNGYTPGTRLQIYNVNENELGISLMVTMTAVLWLATRSTVRFKLLSILMAALFIILTIGLVAASGSRGSAISLLITLGALCLWKPTRLWGFFCVFILAVAILFAPSIFLTTLQRFEVTRGDTLLGGRESLWQAAWELINQHPWQGVGLGNGRIALLSFLGLVETTATQDGVSPHNPVLVIWSETGIPGMVLYLGVMISAIGSFLLQAYRQHRKSIRPLMPYFALVISIFAGFMASWVKGGGMESNFTYFLMLALLLVPSCLEMKDDLNHPEIAPTITTLEPGG